MEDPQKKHTNQIRSWQLKIPPFIIRFISRKEQFTHPLGSYGFVVVFPWFSHTLSWDLPRFLLDPRQKAGVQRWLGVWSKGGAVLSVAGQGEATAHLSIAPRPGKGKKQ